MASNLVNKIMHKPIWSYLSDGTDFYSTISDGFLTRKKEQNKMPRRILKHWRDEIISVGGTSLYWVVITIVIF
jgi:hypothetical protein